MRPPQLRETVRVAPNRRVDVVVRPLERPPTETHHLEVLQKLPVAELHVRQSPQYQPAMAETQRQLVVPEYRERPFEFPPHVRPHQLKLRDRLRQARSRVLLLEREARKATTHVEPKP